MSIRQTKNRKNNTRAVIEYENMDSQTLKKVGVLRGLGIGLGIVCALLLIIAIAGSIPCVVLSVVCGIVSLAAFIYRMKIESYYTRVECSRGRILEDSPYTLATEEKFYVV